MSSVSRLIQKKSRLLLREFEYESITSRIVFGIGKRSTLRQEIGRIGCSRAFIFTSSGRRESVAETAEILGEAVAGVFTGALIHTPVSITDTATARFRSVEADCVVAIGGGTAIGLGKAVAYRTGTPQIVMPTTYSGSESTPIIGQTRDGIKSTIRHASILPDVVILDPELSLSLPVKISVTSGLNAMAHAVEALYARDRNPVSSVLALEGIRVLMQALPTIVADPRNIRGRSLALYASWLCGKVLATVGMALHHKLCHVLGGRFSLPHAETHSILLPHSIAYNQVAAHEELEPLSILLKGPPGLRIFELAKSLRAPTRLSDLGLEKEDLAIAADLAVQSPYWNPRKVSRKGIRILLHNAWNGIPPPD